MGRLTLTLDKDTLAALTRHASRAKVSVATLARQLLREAVERRDSEIRHTKLVGDYAAGRADAREAPQLAGFLDDA